MKKNWNIPVIKILEVDKTELGNTITPHVDDTWSNGTHTYYSFS